MWNLKTSKPRDDLWSRLFPCSRAGTLTYEELYYIVQAVEAFEPSQDALRLCECELTTYRALSAQANSEAWNGAIDAARNALTLAANSPDMPSASIESQKVADWVDPDGKLQAAGLVTRPDPPTPEPEVELVVTAPANPPTVDDLDPDGSMRAAGIMAPDGSMRDVPIVRLDDAIITYCEALTANSPCADLVETVSFAPDPRGRKYTRIVRTTIGKGSDVETSRSVHAFVKREDGTIWKADGWKGPALNFPRGNVFEPEGYATHLHSYGL